MTTTFLADAARNSAKIVTGIYADRVITAALSPDSLPNGHVSHDLTNGVSSQDESADLDSNSDHARAQQAEGVVAYVGTGTDRIKCVFKAPIVVSSAGSINSPAFLLRSGITVNGNVGKHLHLHPSAVAPSIFSEKEHGKMNMWEGPMMTAYSPDAPDWEGSGYGPMVSTPPVSSPTPAGPLRLQQELHATSLACVVLMTILPHCTSFAHTRHTWYVNAVIAVFRSDSLVLLAPLHLQLPVLKIRSLLAQHLISLCRKPRHSRWVMAGRCSMQCAYVLVC